MFHRPYSALGVVPVILHSDAEIFSRDLESPSLSARSGPHNEILRPSGCSVSPQLMEERLRSAGGMNISGVASPMLELSLSEPILILLERLSAPSG